MEPTEVAFDFTIYEEDGETPLFGLVVSAELEADFQTPSPSLPHPRPYLRVPTGWTGQQIQPPHGSATTGAVSIAVVDMPTDPTDQTSGRVTARIKETPGKRARMRRWDPEEATWLPAWEGVVESYSVDPDELLVYWFHLRDGREFQRERSLFFSNYVLLGELATIDGKQVALDGPAIDYGLLPHGRIYFEEEGVQVRSNFLLNRVGPWESIAAGEISHFLRGDPITVFDQTVYWGLTPGINQSVRVRQNVEPSAMGSRIEYYDSPFAFNLTGRMFPVAADDGLYYFEDFWIRWRAKGSDDDWTELRAMPRATPNLAVHGPNQAIPNGAGTFIYSSAPTLYFGSFDEADLPEDDQEIEFQIMASRITPDSPFWWDGGTLGDLLQEIVAGDHTLDPPKERYDAAALAEFALSSPRARFILTAPVTDRMRWIEENIYKPALVVPALNDQLEIAPTSWLAPDNQAEVPLLDPDTVEPVGEWQHGTSNAIGDVEYTYIRERLDPRGEGEANTKDERPDWMRLVEEKVVVQHEADDVLPGAGRVSFAPVTIRTIGSVDGRAPEAGDIYEGASAALVSRTITEVFRLFGPGAPTYEALITATPANRELRAGQLIRFRSELLPDYVGARRGTRRYMLVLCVSEEGVSHRRILLLDTGVPDLTLEEDEDPPEGTEDCLTGGTVYPTATGVVRVFRDDDLLVNTCDHPVTVQLLIVAGGGGGGPGAGVGGGGGAGGALGADDLLEVTLAPGASIPIRVGDGGLVDADGEDSVVWIDEDGEGLDPDVDPAPAATRAQGGGRGSGGNGGSGGSGGGAGADIPLSGGSSYTGGGGVAGQGSDGGGGHSAGGLATCRGAAAGGGGSYGGPGASGALGPPNVGGAGGPATYLEDWGATLGGGGSGGAAAVAGASGAEICGPDAADQGIQGESGFGAGGGGAAITGGTPGSSGAVLVKYEGPTAPLQVPVISSTEVTDQNQATICIEAEDWVPAPAGYQVRVDYAIGTTEPDPTSSDWRLAGYLDAPGCVTTPPLPTGARVWSRATAEATGYLPSASSTASDQDTPQTAGLIGLSLDIDAEGIATLRWEANPFTDTVKVRGVVHDEGDSTARPLPLLDELDSDDDQYVLEDEVPEESIATVDVEAWLGYEEGHTYRVSKKRPRREVITRDDGLDRLSDVTITDPMPGDLLKLGFYDQWENLPPDEALADYFHAERHQGGGDDEIPLDTLGEPSDNTDLDADATRHGLLPKLSADPDDVLRGDGSFGPVPGGASGWTEIIAVANQDVTNNATPQADAELVVAVTAGQYEWELLCVYSGDAATSEFGWRFSFPSSDGWYEFTGKGTTDGIANGRAVFGPTATQHSSIEAMGTMATHGQRTFRAFGTLKVNSSGNLQFEFANVAASPGRVSRRCAGSVLRYKKLT